MPLPLISALIPVYNCESYLDEAIESVVSQGYEPLELIVIDDGSTDGSAAVAQRRQGVRYCYQPHAGVGAARNRAAELAQGEFLAFLDSDDLWTPGKLDRQAAAFAADDDLDIVAGYVEHFRSPELPTEAAARLHCPGQPMAGQHLGAMLIRRSAWSRVGRFATEVAVGEGIDWLLRAAETGLRQQLLPEVVMRRRLHLCNLSRVARPQSSDYARVLKASLDRRRAAGKPAGLPGETGP